MDGWVGLCAFAIIYRLESWRAYLDLRSEEDLRVGIKFAILRFQNHY